MRVSIRRASAKSRRAGKRNKSCSDLNRNARATRANERAQQLAASLTQAGGHRAAVPTAGRGRHRLRDLHARSRQDTSSTGIPGPSASRAMPATKSSAGISPRFYTPEDQSAGIPQKRLATAAQTGKYEAEGWRVRKDGSRFWASVVINAIRDADGELSGLPKSRAISPKGAPPTSAPGKRRKWKASVSSPAASRTTSTIF